jgi:hypothetical protein
MATDDRASRQPGTLLHLPSREDAVQVREYLRARACKTASLAAPTLVMQSELF